jgi:hypothetical protein
MSKRTPDLHNLLRKILYCLEDYESAISESEVESSISSFSELYKRLPGDLPEMYSLLCTMGRAIKETQSAMERLVSTINQKRQVLHMEELSVEARRAASKRFGMEPEHEAGRKLKQDFQIFADCWFHEISFTLRPYWTQPVVDVINTHHHPASNHLGLERTQKQLMDSIQLVTLLSVDTSN